MAIGVVDMTLVDFLGIAHVTEACDAVVLDPDRHGAVDLPAQAHEQSRVAIDEHRFHSGPDTRDPCSGDVSEQEPAHLVVADDGMRRGLLNAIAVAHQHRVRCEHVQQGLQIDGFDLVLERLAACAFFSEATVRGRRASTCWRARCAICRTPAGDLSMAAAISS